MESAAKIEGTTLHLYDSKTVRLQPLAPMTPGHMEIYLYGTAVQGLLYVGHLWITVTFDPLVRWLRCSGMEITRVCSMTDIDDKILNESAQAQAPQWTWTYRYERELTQACETLGVLPPSYESRTAGHIPEQIDLMRRLIECNHTHDDGRGNVYFKVYSQPDHGSLTR